MPKFARQVINQRLALGKYKPFFYIIVSGVTFGMVLSFFDSYEAYIIGLAVAVSAAACCMLLYLIPKLVAMFKKKSKDTPIGLLLVTGRDGEKVKRKRKMQIRDLEL